MDFPEEIWELICKFIDADDYRFLESLSLASTTLLAITNRVRSTFVITDRTLPLLDRHLLRFRKLKRIRFFDFETGFDPILEQISLSGLNLETIDISKMSYFPDFEKLGLKMLSGVKELNCSVVEGLSDSDLNSIGVCFPFLHKLDISHPMSGRISDYGIINMSLKLKRLLEINISGLSFVTNASLVALSRNCVLLREIIFRKCHFVTSKGVEFVMRNSRNLESLAVKRIGWESDVCLFGRCLSKLDLSGSYVSDELMCLIGDAKLPLKKLVLSNCHGFEFDGILYLLNKYQTLLHLNLKGASFLDDEMVMELAEFLPCLTFLNLSFCFELTGLAFFSIIEKCVSLNCIKMLGTDFGEEEEYSEELEIKSRIKSVYISRNKSLRDECLEKLSRHCPFLETLEVAKCPEITSDGILNVLRNCGELRSLDISKCTSIRGGLCTVAFELPKLQKLRICGTRIDDKDLDMISKRCQGLLHLDLTRCVNVRASGVKKVVQNCKRLREISLCRCEVDVGILTWMVCANPSLRRIIPPGGGSLPEKLRNFVLRHGCVICYFF